MSRDQRKGAQSRVRQWYLSWLGEVAALQASAEVLQLHRSFCGLPTLQGFAQATLWAGSTASEPSIETPLRTGNEEQCAGNTSCAWCMTCSLPERVCILCDLCWKHFQGLHLRCQLDLW